MAFSKIEKENIKKNLLENCESIGQNTVIKTNINDLCQISGISKGSFIIFWFEGGIILWSHHKCTQ